MPDEISYESELASKCQGAAQCLSYNGPKHEAEAKHVLHEASHALDKHAVRVSEDFLKGLNEAVHQLIGKAIERCNDNKRKTLGKADV